MAHPEKEHEKSSDWGWNRIWNGPGMPFFFIGLTFVFIGISNVTFLILGIVFIAIAFTMGNEDEKKRSDDSGEDGPSSES